MEKLDMQSKNLVNENIEKIAKLFPNCITEGKDKNGEITKLVDFDLLKQELSSQIVEGNDERYTLNWAGKKQSVLTANTPINATLRPCREESVDFDNTKNLYIEGDNLDVLKLLRETYLGKVKMIYIDPPYNTGHDFVYEDDFSTSFDEYLQNSKSYDEQGNKMFQNNDSNGRFHSDWLSMMYSRLRVSKDLLTDDGVIFISIDDNELDNLSKILDEIFSENNFICKFIWKSKLGKVGTTSTISTTHEYILCYAKNIELCEFKMIISKNEGRKENLRQWGVADRKEDRPSMYYPIYIDGKEVYPIKDDGSDGRWRVGKEMAEELLADGVLELQEKNGKYNIYRNFPAGETYIPYDTLLLDQIGTTAKGSIMLKNLDMQKLFDFSKPVELIKHFIFLSTDENDIIMDYFSGSATTAHSIMQINAEEDKNRKFIMIQIPEICKENSEAYIAGYKNICEIGKERIRRAGRQIINEIDNSTRLFGKDVQKPFKPTIENKQALQMAIEKIEQDDNSFEELADKKYPDVGFRVLKLDSSCMKDVYYDPNKMSQDLLAGLEDNIKEDRTPEDLLFQVMLDMGVMLSSEIKILDIQGKKVFNVNDGNLVCCFDKNLTDEVVTEIAKMKPLYAVFRDSSMAKDSVAVNFDQIFETYSSETVRKVL